MKFFLCISVLSLLLFQSTVYAHEESTVIFGWGGLSCQEYAEIEFKDEEYFQGTFMFWTKGYLSGLNMAKRDGKGKEMRDFSSLRDDEILNSIEKYCADNPTSHIFLALDQVYKRANKIVIHNKIMKD